MFVTCRVYFMGSTPPEFAPADNPASDSGDFATRALTFAYLPFLNFWLLLFPKTLSFDWSMEAVPLIESPHDPRNVCTLAFYAALGYSVLCICRNLNQDGVNSGSAPPSPYSSSSSSTHHHSKSSRERSYSNNSQVNVNSNHNNSNGKYYTTQHSWPNNNTFSTTKNGLTPPSAFHQQNGSTANGGGHNHTSHQPSLRHSPNSMTSSLRHSPANVTSRRRHMSHRRGSSSSDSSEDSVFSSAHAHNTPQSYSAWQLLVISLCIVILPFIPATNLFFYVGFVIAERVLYIPSMGFILLVAYGAYVITLTSSRGKHVAAQVSRDTLVAMVLACLVLGYSVRTVLRNEDWKTEENLYRSGIPVNPAKG